MTKRRRARAAAGVERTTAPRRAETARLEASISRLRRFAVPVGLIVALVVVAYSNALRNGFVLDDVPIIVENPIVRDVSNVGTVFGTTYWHRGGVGLAGDSTLYRPLTILSYGLDHALWGIDARAFHATNVALHAAACVLVFVLAVELFGTALAAFAVAAVFAVHPIHTEAVTGIVGRAELLATAFFLAALLTLRLRGEENGTVPARDASPGWGRVVGGGVLYLLGLLSKESAVTLPLVLALDDWLRRSALPRDPRTRMRALVTRYGALAVALGVYLALRTNAVTGSGRMWPGFVGVSAFERVLTASRVLLEYIGLFVIPSPLLADYWKHDVPIARSLAEPLVLLSLLVWVAIGVVVVRWRNRDAALMLSLSWFFITIAPVSNVAFPIGVGKAERILYLPSVGLCLVVGWLVAKAMGRLRYPALVYAALACAILPLAARTVLRNNDWRDNFSIAMATLAVSPTSPLMNDLAAGELFKRGDAKRAVELLRVAVREAPEMALLRSHLGAAYHSQGRIDEAIVEYMEAIRTNPTDASAYNNLGVAYRDQGREADALAQFAAAVRINSRYADPHTNIGSIHLEHGRLAEAQAAFAAAVAADPLNAGAHNALGIAYQRLGRLDRAAEQFREALRLDPTNAAARANLDRLGR